MSVKVCKQCKKANESLYKYCLGCGAELPDEVVTSSAAPSAAPKSNEFAPIAQALGGAHPCTSCSSLVPPGYRFCPSCGADQQGQGTSRGGTPTGRLVLIRPDGTDGGTHDLIEGENLIGRNAGGLFEADGYLSPHHADLILNGAGAVIRDVNSLNGVFVRVRQEEELYDGDILRIGQELLRFDAVPPPQPLEDGTEILGSPNPGYWGRLAIVVGPDQEGSAFPLSGDAIYLGRERGDILFPEDGYVSGSHARVVAREGGFYLEDMGSSNGTFLRIRGELPLPSGSFLLMGQQLFRVEY
jgi:hypothetical protein